MYILIENLTNWKKKWAKLKNNNSLDSLNNKFEEKSVSLVAIKENGNVKLTRVGNLVVGELFWTGGLFDNETVIFNVPNEFRPTIEYRVRPVQEQRYDVESWLRILPNGNLSIVSRTKDWSDFFEATLVWYI